MRTTGGTKGRADHIPQSSAPAVERLLAAGAILVGKTNTPELTLHYETDNLVFGRTRNPYDLSKSAGGSSGGARSPRQGDERRDAEPRELPARPAEFRWDLKRSTERGIP